MTSADAKLLKLRAIDGEDLQILSAVLQDAIVPVCDMVWQAENRRFVMVAQRLRREIAQGGACERICAALTITGISAAQLQNIDARQGTRMLDLLAVMLDDGGAIELVFAGGARVRLATASWSAALEDFGDPWPASLNPCHDDNAD